MLFYPKDLVIRDCFSPLEERVCSAKDSVDDREVRVLKLGGEFWKKGLPLVREILLAYHTDGIAELEHTNQI